MPRRTEFQIPRRRLGFVWRRPGGAPAPWRLGFLCIYRRGRSPVTGQPFVPSTGSRVYPFGFVICMRPLLAWLLALAFAGYFAGAGALHARLQEDPLNRVAYADLVAPWRWSRIPRLRAETTLARGKQLHDHGQINEALFLLRVGLERCPEDVDARVRLASIYLVLSRRDLADAEFFNSLKAGVVNDALIRDALAFLQDSDRPAQLLDFCRQARQTAALGVAARQSLVAAETSALIELGRASEALASLASVPDASPAFLAQTRARIALASEDVAAAEDAVAAWIAAAPRSPEALAMGVGVSRQAGLHEEMDRRIADLRAVAPDNPSFASMGVVQNLLAGRNAEADAAFDELVFRFGGDVRVLEAMARDLGKIQAFAMLDRLETVFAEHGFDSQILLFSRLNARMDAADWRGAEHGLAALGARADTLSDNIRAFRQTALAILDHCVTGAPAAKSTALDLLVKRPVRLKLYLQIHDWFCSASRWEGARDVLVLAEGAFPGSRRLDERRRALEPRLLARSDAQAKTARETERKKDEPRVEMQSAGSLLAALATLEKQSAWSESLRMIESARRRAPAWLPSIRNRLDQAELRAALGLDDLPRIKLSASNCLRDGGASNATEICALARSARAQDRSSAARLLLSEVLRRSPGQPEASALLAEWAAKEGPREP